MIIIILPILMYLSIAATVALGANHMRNRVVPELLPDRYDYNGQAVYRRTFTPEQKEAQSFWSVATYTAAAWPLQILYVLGWGVYIGAQYIVTRILSANARRAKGVAERKFREKLEEQRQEILDRDPDSLQPSDLSLMRAIEHELGVEPINLKPAIEAAKPVTAF